HSTRHSPYYLLFHRHPRLPGVMNVCPMGDDFEVADPEEDIDSRVQEMTVLNETVSTFEGVMILVAQDSQRKTYGSRKRKHERACTIQEGDDVLLSGHAKKRRTGDTLSSQHQGPFTVAGITAKGVATIMKGATRHVVNVSRLRSYKRCSRNSSARVQSPKGEEVAFTNSSQKGDPAILKLALVCSTFRDHVSSEHFRRRAHFKWLRSVCTWSRFSTLYREQYFVMYSIEVCRECGEMYKHCPRGFVGSGKRGQLRGFYSEDMPPGYCSYYCEQISSY
ncbi:hypothetical protein FQA47_010553, partial [Oryzias melastigma]